MFEKRVKDHGLMFDSIFSFNELIGINDARVATSGNVGVQSLRSILSECNGRDGRGYDFTPG